MKELLTAYRKCDPAAKSHLEVLFLYPGVKAIAFHRLAHVLFRWRVPFVPRAISELGRWVTGIEIHPGAVIGRRVIFDHGLGIVIGETAEVGDDVILYQGVTLGGTSLNPLKRHPTLESRIVVGAGAKVLGNIRVGCDSRIGANAVVIRDVPPGSTVVGNPGKVIARPLEHGRELAHDDLGDFDASI